MSRKKTTDLHRGFSDLRRELLALARRNPKETRATDNLLALLEELEGMCLHQLTPSARYGRPKSYYRVMSVRGVCLAEAWESGRQPFYVPQELYEKCAGLLAQHDSPRSFKEIISDLAKVCPEPQEYQVRTCLRFWRQLDPPLVEVVRRRYRAKRPDKFVAGAAKAWRQLPEAPA